MNSRALEPQDMGGMFADLDPTMREFFAPKPRRGRPPKLVGVRAPAERPDHYKVISISLYVEDIERLKSLVDTMKRAGHTRANQSMVIREALRQLDVDLVPPQR